MHPLLKAFLFGLVAPLAWLTLGWLLFVRNVGDLPATDPLVILAGGLLVAAPALTFVPLARVLHAPLYDVEGIVGWSTFGFVITFLSPGETLSRGEFLIFLLPLTVAIASVATLVAHAFDRRIHRGAPHRQSFLRARRQGYLAALVVVALFLLNGIQVLSPVSGLLLLVVAILCEVVMLSRDRQEPAPRSMSQPRPQNG